MNKESNYVVNSWKSGSIYFRFDLRVLIGWSVIPRSHSNMERAVVFFCEYVCEGVCVCVYLWHGFKFYYQKSIIRRETSV